MEAQDREPWVYLKCGHLHSYHQWKAEPKESDSKRTCPMCREVSGTWGVYYRSIVHMNVCELIHVTQKNSQSILLVKEAINYACGSRVLIAQMVEH